MKDHEKAGVDFTKDLTPAQILERLTEFAVFGLEGNCAEVDQLVEKLEIQQELAAITEEACMYWQEEYFKMAQQNGTLDQPDRRETE